MFQIPIHPNDKAKINNIIAMFIYILSEEIIRIIFNINLEYYYYEKKIYENDIQLAKLAKLPDSISLNLLIFNLPNTITSLPNLPNIILPNTILPNTINISHFSNYNFPRLYSLIEQEQEELSKKKLIYKASKKKQRQYNHHKQKMIKAQLNYKNKRNKCKNR